VLASISFLDRESYGKIYAYDKSYDRSVNTKNEKPLQIIDRIKYNTTTTDDPIIQQVCFVDVCIPAGYSPFYSLPTKIPRLFMPQMGFSACSCAPLGLCILGTLSLFARGTSCSLTSAMADHSVITLLNVSLFKLTCLVRLCDCQRERCRSSPR
jgi:hypothetical protein